MGVAAGDGHRLGIHIAAPDVVAAVEFLVPRLVLGPLPAVAGHKAPLLRVEGPVQARRPVPGNQRRLDGDGAAAAEGVAEGIPSPIAGELHQRRRQRLPQGRLHAHGTVTPLEQALAAGVQRQQHLILEDGEAYLILGAGLRKLLQMVRGLHPLHHGLLDDALAGGHGVELGGDRVPLYREGRVTGQIVLPRHGAGALKQLLEAAGREVRQHQHHPRAAAQVDVQPCAVLQRAPAQNAAVLRLHVLQAQTLALIAYQFFQPQQTGDHICIHRATSKNVSYKYTVYRNLSQSARQTAKK